MTEISTSLYRKYRPSAFTEVRNQDHIIAVLEGAIAKKTIPHALLFTGSRGTGKTTVARIFARAIGAAEVDTYEIDAASNRGIDDVRALKDAVHTLPFQSPYKVYIIDEVHMLTKEAFNALLKTLEEPPEHVVFILATTEQDKLLDTITSRCQVFQFRAPSRSVLQELILDVAKKEKCTLDAAGADMIALAADGSFRDALGITQKVFMAVTGDRVEVDQVALLIGAPKNTLIMEIIGALDSKDSGRGLKAVQQAVESHVDMKLFIRLLLERVRLVMLLRHAGEETDALMAQYGDDDRAALIAIARNRTSPIQSALLVRLLEAAEQTGKTYLPHLPLELAIIELTAGAS